MISFLISLLLVLNPVTFVAERNYNLKKAEQAFQKNEYLLANQYYTKLIADLEWKHENLDLNLAHTYFLSKKYEDAAKQYQKIVEKQNVILASVALNQLGYLATINQDLEGGLQYFLNAIKLYPQNSEARYNYELMKKILKKRVRNTKKKQPKSQDSTQLKDKKLNTNNGIPDNKGQAQTTQSSDNKNVERKLNPQKLKDLQLNKEKAEAILNSLKNQEMQYIQQVQQKKNLQNNNKNNLPDW